MQKKKILIDPGKKKYDIMTDDTFFSLIVSERAKIVFERSGVKGIRFVPCLIKGEDYSEREKQFNDLGDIGRTVEGQYWQMIIDRETRKPLSILGDGQSVIRCDACGESQVYKHMPGKHSIWYFNKKEDVGDEDLLRVSRAQYSENLSTVNIFEDWILMSGKVLATLLTERVTGIRSKEMQVLPIVGETIEQNDLETVKEMCGI